MAQPPPTRLHIDPPIEQWQVAPRIGRTRPIIATGHQPTLWHPGILAKYLAADVFAKHVGGSTLNVIVEHNPVPPTGIDLPIQRGQALQVTRLNLDGRPVAIATPPNRLAALDAKDVAGRLVKQADAPGVAGQMSAGLHQLAQAYETTGPHKHLAAQASAVLDELMRPYLHQPMQTLPTSALVTPGFVDRLLQDPLGCARCYNRAAQAYPEAGIRPLYLGRDVVEAPLWAQCDGACSPVYIDLGDHAKPLLFTQGQPLDLASDDALQYLRPRAITLSAIMRSELCDLFIHGTGGGIYDQVTEHWWQDWVGEDLAPVAVVSADVYLPFDVPVATQQQRIQAQWFAHHLQNNMDRYTQATGEHETQLRDEKQDLLDRMNDDRDQRRRGRAFKRIHAINAELRGLHRETLMEARRQANDARAGVANAAIARRRDWCFALYPDQQVQDLAVQISSRLHASPG